MAFALLLAAGGLAWLLVRQRYFYGWVDDDAFISFRYARNLAEGNGLVFNLGERVEGYTNFLWTVLLALAYRSGAELPSAGRALGALFSVATVGVLALFARTSALRVPDVIPPTMRPFVLLVAPLTLCLFEPWAAWAAGGLENVLSGLLIALAFLLYALYLDVRKSSVLVLAALGFALAVLNHPSNTLFALVVGLHLVARARTPRSHLVWAAIPFVAVVGSWTVWRLTYYGDLLPNTFHAKVGFTRFVVLRGLGFLVEMIRGLPVPYLATLLLGVLLTRRRISHPIPGILFVAVVLHTAYVVAVGGEEFPALRASVVLLPLFALILQICVYVACVALAQPTAPHRPVTPTQMRAPLAGLLLVATLLTATGPLYLSPRVRILDEALRQGRTALSTTAALKLKDLLPEDTLFAHSGAGLIAFYTNFPWIDTLGLTDRHIARTSVTNMGKGAAGHEKGDGAYVWSRKPDFVMFPGYPISNRLPGTKTGRELFAIPGFQQTYRSVRLPFDFQGPVDDVPRRYHLFLWERIDRSGG